MAQHADPLDKAAEQSALEIEYALRRRAATPRPAYGPAECVECDDDMPEARRVIGAVRCTDCQGRADTLAKQFARR